jgi:hypothetical protein
VSAHRPQQQKPATPTVTPAPSPSATPPPGPPILARRPAPAVSYPRLFVTQFAATLLAVLIGGAVLLVGLRVYLHWSVASWADGVQERMKQANAPRPGTVPTAR